MITNKCFEVFSNGKVVVSYNNGIEKSYNPKPHSFRRLICACMEQSRKEFTPFMNTVSGFRNPTFFMLSHWRTK